MEKPSDDNPKKSVVIVLIIFRVCRQLEVCRCFGADDALQRPPMRRPTARREKRLNSPSIDYCDIVAPAGFPGDFFLRIVCCHFFTDGFGSGGFFGLRM